MTRKRRYEVGLRIEPVLPPQETGKCLCGCGRGLTGRRWRWATDECQHKATLAFRVIRGDSSAVRQGLRERNNGFCDGCGEQVEVLASRWPKREFVEVEVIEELKPWQGHHLIPVAEGGGGCDLSGYETLCKRCHDAETRNLYQRLTLVA